MGEASLERPANDDELKRLESTFRQALRDGGFGWSSTMLDGHVGYGGRPVACRQADRREIETLCRVMREEQLGSVELVFNPELGSLSDEALEFLRFVTSASGRRATYLAMINQPDDPESYQRGVAKLGGLLSSGQVLPQFPVKPITTNFNLRAPNILSFNASLRRALDLSIDQIKALYQDPDFRVEVQRDFDNNEVSHRFFDECAYSMEKAQSPRRRLQAAKVSPT